MRVELLNGKDIENRIRTIATAGKLSRTKGNVFDVWDSCSNYDKNVSLINRIIGMGHKAIIEHDYFVFALSDVSPIVEQTIIGYRLTSFTIKSGREVDFRNVGYYVPNFRNVDGNVSKDNQKLQKLYCEQMDSLFHEYGQLVDAGIKEEDARFVLPYSFHTNIVMGLDGHELEKMVTDLLYGKRSRIAELKELGQELFKVIEQYIPYLVPLLKAKEENSQDEWKEFYSGQRKEVFPETRLVSYTPNVDEKILEVALRYRNQISQEQVYELEKELDEKDPNWREKLFQQLKGSTEQRELEFVQFEFEIPISLIILKHLTRHRMQSLLVPDFVPLWNMEQYQTPPSIREWNEAKYQEIMMQNRKVLESFKKENLMEEDLIYFYQCGQFVNVVTSMNGRTLEWISRMRCCTKAQWEIRKIARDMVSQVKQVAPLYGTCLGSTCDVYHTCPEGRESCGKVKTR